MFRLLASLSARGSPEPESRADKNPRPRSEPTAHAPAAASQRCLATVAPLPPSIASPVKRPLCSRRRQPDGQPCEDNPEFAPGSRCQPPRGQVSAFSTFFSLTFIFQNECHRRAFEGRRRRWTKRARSGKPLLRSHRPYGRKATPFSRCCATSFPCGGQSR